MTSERRTAPCKITTFFVSGLIGTIAANSPKGGVGTNNLQRLQFASHMYKFCEVFLFVKNLSTILNETDSKTLRLGMLDIETSLTI